VNYFDERRHYTVDRLTSRIEHLGYRVHLELSVRASKSDRTKQSSLATQRFNVPFRRPSLCQAGHVHLISITKLSGWIGMESPA
jgi:hypothetical protein